MQLGTRYKEDRTGSGILQSSQRKYSLVCRISVSEVRENGKERGSFRKSLEKKVRKGKELSELGRPCRPHSVLLLCRRRNGSHGRIFIKITTFIWCSL